MFKGKQIKSLIDSTSKLEKENTDLKDKLSDLEKLMESTKESLNELSASRFESISSEIKEFNTKMEDSMETLGKLQHDMGEISSINKILSELKDSVDNLTSDASKQKLLVEELEKFKTATQDEIPRLNAEFSESRNTVQTIKTELSEERQVVAESQETIVKQEVTIKEKISQLEKIENELRESRSRIGKLEAQNDNYERQLKELKEVKDSQYKELTNMQEEFTKAQGRFSFNTAVIKVLDLTTEGKIILELQKESPLSLDNLSKTLNVAQVILKQAVNQLADIEAIKVDSDGRTLRL